jgi:tail fiber assembly protein lambda gpK
LPAEHTTDARHATPPVATVRATFASGERYDVSSSSVPLDVRPAAIKASEEEREAILQSLYAERANLTRAGRLGMISQRDEEYLVELNAYIDRWEAPEVEAATSSNVWRSLDELASSMLSLQARVERNRR